MNNQNTVNHKYFNAQDEQGNARLLHVIISERNGLSHVVVTYRTTLITSFYVNLEEVSFTDFLSKNLARKSPFWASNTIVEL